MEHVGILLILLQQLLFTLDAVAIHHVADSLTLWQIGLLRSIGGLGLVICFVPKIGWKVFHTHHLGLQIVRAVTTVAYTWVFVFSFTHMPFTDATAISYTQALYVAFLAPPILGEVVGGRRALALIVGIIGVLLIVKPGFLQTSPIYLAVLAATSLNALALVLNRYLQRQDSSVTVMLYVNVASFIVFLPGIAAPLPSIDLWPWLVAICIAGPLGMYSGILAVRYAEASTLAPFSYVRLLLAMIATKSVFNESLDLASLIGSICIIAACVLADRTIVAWLIRRKGIVG